MLLVEAPDRNALMAVIEGLLDGSLSREAVSSWQQAIVGLSGWSLPIAEAEGYWYFYSLKFVNLPFPGGFFVRDVDLREYLADMQQQPGDWLAGALRHKRAFELNRAAVRWPIGAIHDCDDLMLRVPGTRGTFEQRQDLVEHCHLTFEEDDYLLVKQFDEQTDQVLLLGNNRDRDKAERLLHLLSVSDYMLP